MNKLTQKDKIEILLAIYALFSLFMYIMGHNLGKLVLSSSFGFLLVFYLYQTIAALWNGMRKKIAPLAAIVNFFIYYNAFMALLCSFVFLLFVPGSQMLIMLGLISAAGILTMGLLAYVAFRKNNRFQEAIDLLMASFPRMFILLVLCAMLKSIGMPELYKKCGPFRNDPKYIEMMRQCVDHQKDCEAFTKYDNMKKSSKP